MNARTEPSCWSCLSIAGVRRISPGPIIFQGRYWIVEHAYPVALLGWLVIVLKRHAEALHTLTPEEFAECGYIQQRACQLLYEILDCEKEYIMCLAEAEHFHHIHYHVVPKSHDLPEALKGTHIFSLLKVPVESAVAADKVKDFCELLRSRWAEDV
jgi:diadenosine tetraphosphate (Ap4A) HIT family hydrolase